MKCPKCGSEMRMVQLHAEKPFPAPIVWIRDWRCLCGHEEKVKT